MRPRGRWSGCLPSRCFLRLAVRQLVLDPHRRSRSTRGTACSRAVAPAAPLGPAGPGHQREDHRLCGLRWPAVALEPGQIRRRRPGVTAAATTAVFATGAGPGVTAFATTAVLATGWPMTPTLPTRAALRGIPRLLRSQALRRPRWRR